MRVQALFSIGVFVLTAVLHASYSIFQTKTLLQRWEGGSEVNFLLMYFERSEYLISGSYALAIGFSVYALLRFLESQKGGMAGLAGGVTLTGILYVGGCFLVGCCGSPMLAVYLTLFGSTFLEFTKPLTFALTFVFVVVGYIWMKRKLVPTTGATMEALCECEGKE